MVKVAQLSAEKHLRLPVALAVVAALAACGGSGEENVASPKESSQASQVAAVSESSVTSVKEKNLQIEADIRGIGRMAYALSPSYGAYGARLAAEGWETRISNLANVPNTASTILYLNADDSTLNTNELQAFVARFVGVLVIDSDLRFPVAAAVDVDEKGEPIKAQNLMEPQEPTSSSAADYYVKLSGNEAAWAPVATALITSSTSRSLMPITVDAKGGVNGSPGGLILSTVDLRMVALSNQLEQEKAGKPNNTTVKGKGFSSTPGSWDRVIDMNYTADGWNVIGRGFIEAFKEGSGTRRFVAVEIDTGTNVSQCLVNGKECGIYPQSRANLLKREYHSDNIKSNVISYAVAYSARARVYPATQVMEYRPSQSAWTATETIDSDSYEKVWSEGFSVGGSAGLSSAGTVSFGPSASYSKSTSHRKRMHSWDGAGGFSSVNWADAGTTWKSHDAYSGVDIKSTHRYNFIGVKATSAGFDKDIRDSQLRSLYCYGTGKTWAEKAKPKMSFEGWNPNLSSMFEVPASRVNASSNNHINVRLSLDFSRQLTAYEPVSNQRCYRSPGSYGYKSYTGSRIVGQTANGDGRVYVGTRRSYERGVTIKIYPTSFNN
jgi:hypothetical protein